MSTFTEYVEISQGLFDSPTIAKETLKQLKILPIHVTERPFAADPNLGLMLPGGFFDVSRGKQLIGIYYTPTMEFPPDIMGIYYVLETPPSSGIKLTWSPPAHTLLIHRYPAGKPPEKILFPGRPILRFTEADFTNASPGKHTLNFKAYSIPLTGKSIKRRPEWDFQKQIFVIKTTADHLTNTFIAECSEGKLVLHNDEVGVYPWMDWNTWMTPSTTAILGSSSAPPLVLPIAFTAEMYPAKPFYGKFGPIPFEDPWWKWVLGALAAIFAVLGGIFGKKSYDGGANWACTQSQGVGGYKKQCTLEGPEEAVGNGVLSAGFSLAAYWLAKAALSDEKDPFRVGEENTNPSPNEATTKETLSVQIDYKEFPNIAGPLDIGVSWQFDRYVDSGKVYSYKKDWVIHEDAVNTKSATSQRSYHLNETVSLSASFYSGKTQLKGTDAFVLGFLYGPKGKFEPIYYTDETKPGEYEASITFTSNDDVGHWDAYIIAQSVDQSLQHEDPEEAAKSPSGGGILNQILKIKDGRKCIIEVVKSASFEIKPAPIEIK